MPAQTPRKILSGEFAQALADAGIIDDPGSISRIVLDAKAGEPLRMYVEHFADERWLNVALALDGIEITTQP